ncbi:MAG: hypothetical protein RBT78_12055 [Kiritimatiellia bacterium]|nr:hypothetical protein [Kiritimatiellia bacterium]
MMMTLLAGNGASAALSDSALVDATTSRYRHWSTVYTNTVPLRWDWIPEATHAKLNIVGMRGTFTTNFAADVSTCLWQAFDTAATSEEDVYDLALTVYGDGETILETLTARLAVVAGAVGGAAINAVAESAAWSQVRKNVVIPYDAAWEPAASNALSATLEIARAGGPSQTATFADAAGDYGWKLIQAGWGYGTFNLSLTFPEAGEPLTATLTRPIDGTMVRVQ